MDRRAFLTGAGAVAAASTTARSPLAAPAVSRGAAAGAVRLVPHADVANFDPVWTTAYIARNAGVLVFDMLYGVDSTLTPRRQMVEAEEVSADGLTWTFRLRDGLTFHDGDKVTARDAVASINRWAARDSMGQMVKAIENELIAVDDRSFRWRLRKPFPRLLLALGKIATPCCFVMPERIAATSPFQLITDYTGSGPMRFVREQWEPGARAVFERFDGYTPRPEPASWLAGGKRVVADRIEWVIIPDQATAAAAVQRGEVDWLEQPMPDLIPLLRRNRSLAVGVADPLGNVGAAFFNHLYPPFDDVRARRAFLMAMSQKDYMQAYCGDDASLWKPLPGFFTPRTPLYTEDGGEVVAGRRDLSAAKAVLAASGYAGEPVVTMAAQDIPAHKAWGDVTADVLARLGVTVDYAALDWGTVVARRAQKAKPAAGGWQLFHTFFGGADLADPASRILRANGDAAFFGWPSSPAIEAEVAAWFDAATPDEEKAVARRLNRLAFDHALYAPLGWFLQLQAFRTSLGGVAPGPLPFFWGVTKTA